MPITELSINCQSCSFNHLRVPINLNKHELETRNDIIGRKRPLHKHHKLVNAGDNKFHSLYAIRSGSFKSYISDSHGIEQLTVFYFAGDIVAFDALKNNVHSSYTQGLETSMVSELPYDTLDKVFIMYPNLRQQIMRFMRSEIKHDHELIKLLSKRSAEERLLRFINNLSQHFDERGYSAKQFNLSMIRNEIGKCLRLRVETISRLLTPFQKGGLIKVAGKLISIIDVDAIKQRISENHATL
jgi:CRP/FNR family transcriptional regulator